MSIPFIGSKPKTERAVSPDWFLQPFVHPDISVREKDLVRDALALAKELHHLSSVLSKAVSDRVVILLDSAEKYESCLPKVESVEQEKAA